jgi:hypothetical protein
MRSRKKLLPVAAVAAGLLVTGLGGAAHAAQPGGGDTVTPAPADPVASDSPDNLRIILAGAVRELLRDLLQADDQADDPEAAARAVPNNEQLPLPTPPAPVPSLPDPGVTPSQLPTPRVPLVPPLPTPTLPPLPTPALQPLTPPAIPPVSVLPLPAPLAEPPVESPVAPPVGDLSTGPTPGTTSDAPAGQPATG